MGKNASISTGGPEWSVTFLNNAGNLPLLEVDDSALWGGVIVAVEEERAGTSVAVSGSFELGLESNASDRVVVPHDASATEVSNYWKVKLLPRVCKSEGTHMLYVLSNFYSQSYPSLFPCDILLNSRKTLQAGFVEHLRHVSLRHEPLSCLHGQMDRVWSVER